MEVDAAVAAEEDILHIAELEGKLAGMQRVVAADAIGAFLSMLTTPSDRFSQG